MDSLWRVSLQRMRADWPIVAAAWLITLLSAVLFASGVIYPAAAAEAGLQRALRDAPVASRSLEIARYDRAAGLATLDPKVIADLQGVIAVPGGTVVRDWRGSATLALVPSTGGTQGDQVEVGYLEGLADHATLIAGAWPADGPGGAATPAPVAIAQAAADALGLHVGDTVEAIARPGSGQREVALQVVAVYAAADPRAAYWNEDAQLLTGLHDNGRYRTFGPLLMTQSELLRVIGDDEFDLRWRVFPDFDRLAVDAAGPLSREIDGIPARLLVDAGAPFTLNSALPGILREAERSLLVSRTSVVLLMAQLALLAGYAIVLIAALLVDHRRVDTALLRARGAGSLHVARLSLIEALVFAVTAVVAAPTLAAAAVGLFNVVGPLADVGLGLAPTVTTDAYLAAGAAAALCVVLLVLPAAMSARAFAQEQGGRSRQETRTLGQRMGLDVVLIAVTGIALWQLRLYGAPLTRSVQGQLGLDPLLVAAPAIGLVAGGVLALRMLPLLAQMVEAGVARGRGLLTSLGARQLARRPLRYTRSALLLVLAISMGVFALSYAATWSTSQRDQAAYQAGADVRLPAVAAGSSVPAWALAGALAGLPDVAAITPVERITDGIKFAAAGSADLLAMDADTAGSIALLRADASSVPFEDLLGTLRAARPVPALPILPDGTTALRIVPASQITAVAQYSFDPETQQESIDPLDPTSVLVQMRASVTVRDGHGLLSEFRSELVTITGAGAEIVIPLQVPGSVPMDLDDPVAIAGLAVEIWLPEDSITSKASFGVRSAGASTSATGPWTDIPLDAVGPWTAGRSAGHELPEAVPASSVKGVTVEVDDRFEGVSGIFGRSEEPSTSFRFVPGGLEPAGGAVPVIANRAFADRYDASAGNVLTATLAGRFLRLSIAGVMKSFPTTDPARPLLIVDEATIGLLRLGTVTPTRPVDEWWLAARPGSVDALESTLAQPPFERPELVSASSRTRQLSTDPVALGIIGALTLGFVVTGLFAILGMTVSAGVSARQQRTEFALLRALGLSGRQLSGSLWLEHGTVVVLGLVTGTGLGLLIAWLVLPFVTVTQGGLSPVPPVLIEVPWDRVLALDLVSGGALALAVFVIGAALRRLRVGATLRTGED